MIDRGVSEEAASPMQPVSVLSTSTIGRKADLTYHLHSFQTRDQPTAFVPFLNPDPTSDYQAGSIPKPKSDPYMSGSDDDGLSSIQTAPINSHSTSSLPSPRDFWRTPIGSLLSLEGAFSRWPRWMVQLATTSPSSEQTSKQYPYPSGSESLSFSDWMQKDGGAKGHTSPRYADESSKWVGLFEGIGVIARAGGKAWPLGGPGIPHRQSSYSRRFPALSITSTFLLLLLSAAGILLIYSKCLGLISTDRAWLGGSYSEQPLLLLVTPTYTRAFQAIYITNIANVLRALPPPVLWLVMEAGNKTEETSKLLKRTAGHCTKASGRTAKAFCVDVPYIHMGVDSKVEKDNSFFFRGVSQRNQALNYITQKKLDGLIYFMDDDNAYSIQVFEEIRKIKRIGIFPVGFVYHKAEGSWKKNHISRPAVRINGSRAWIHGWEANGKHIPLTQTNGTHRYISDMAGFAFRSSLLWEPTDKITGRPIHPVRFEATKKGYLETQFLSHLIEDESALELMADNCQDVWVWHRHVEASKKDPYAKLWRVPQSNITGMRFNRKPQDSGNPASSATLEAESGGGGEEEGVEKDASSAPPPQSVDAQRTPGLSPNPAEKRAKEVRRDRAVGGAPFQTQYEASNRGAEESE